jgi:hypothetical protein
VRRRARGEESEELRGALKGLRRVEGEVGGVRMVVWCRAGRVRLMLESQPSSAEGLDCC